MTYRRRVHERGGKEITKNIQDYSCLREEWGKHVKSLNVRGNIKANNSNVIKKWGR